MAIIQFPGTDFHDLNLDWILEQVKNLLTEWGETKEEWETLKGSNEAFVSFITAQIDDFKAYVENYLANLPISDEISAKINAMIDDGTFLELLVDPAVPGEPAPLNEVVEGWLNTHIHEGYAVDDTLTQAGAAADAKATGDQISDLKGALNGIKSALDIVYSQNLFNPDAVSPNSVIDRTTGQLNENNQYKTSDFIACNSNDIIYLTNITQLGAFQDILTVSAFRIGFYSEDKTYISYVDYGNSTPVPSGAKYFRFTIPSSSTATWCVTLNWYPTNASEVVYYESPYYNLPNRVTALEHATQPLLKLYTVDCWGDSMTEGGSTGATYPNILATELGNNYTVNNYGKSSQTSGEVAFRFGTNPVYIKINGNQIPATTTPVTVDDIICTTGDRLTRRNFGNFAGNGVHCVVEGVQGMLNCLVGVGKSFTRDTQGDAVTANGYVKVWSDKNYSDENICIFWAGKNDTAMADTYIVKGTVDNIYGMTHRMQHKQYIVLPVFKSHNEGIGTTMYNKITQINDKLKTLYPNNYLDIQSMLIAHGLEDAEITPTQEDEEAIANDTIPPSLLANDGIHPNETCRSVYVKYIKKFMQDNGWLN